MVSALFRILRYAYDLKAASRGPGALGRRVIRRKATGAFARILRRKLPP